MVRSSSVRARGSHASSLLKVLLLIWAVVVGTAAIGLVAAPQAFATITLSGRVVDTSGDPAVKVRADTFQWDGDSWEGRGWILTDENGSYIRELSEDGLYRMMFWDGAGDWTSEWYNNTPFLEAAYTFDLHDGDVRSANAVLERAGAISGTVTNGRGDPIQGISVDVFHYYPQIDEWRGQGSVTTDENGYYEHRGLPAGPAQVHFSDPDGVYANESYDDVHQGQPTPVPVMSGQATQHIDASLTEGVTITGYVTSGPPLFTPLSGIRVMANRFVEGMGWPGVLQATTASGAYELKGMPAGTYHVAFLDDGGTYLDEWWNDRHQDFLADPIELAAGQSQGGVNAALEEPGHIAGTVTGAGAGALGNIHVTVHVDRGQGQWKPPLAQAWTDVDGRYDVGGLAPGNYRVCFQDDAQGYWVRTWNGGAPAPDQAADVPVTSGSSTQVDAVLTPAGAIGGTVRDEGGTALQGIHVFANAWNGEGWGDAGATTTGTDGTFLLGGLAPGTYRVNLRDPSGTYACEVWQDVAVYSAGTDVPVHAAQTTPIDPVLGAGGRLMGQVVNPQGQPLEGIGVDVLTWVDDQSGGQWQVYESVQTAQNGFFNAGGLIPGQTVLSFQDYGGAYLSEFFDNAGSPEAAAPVLVTAGQTNGIGVVSLDAAGGIAGHVTDGEGAGIDGIQVKMIRWNDQDQEWQFFGSCESHDGGQYERDDLQPGQYIVEFWDDSGEYVNETYDDVPGVGQPQGAQPLQVNDGQRVEGIDAVLARGATISGYVTDALGNPISGISVWAERFRSNDEGNEWWEWQTEATTENGAYELRGLSPGTYLVGFRDDGGTYASEWWQDARGQWQATSFVLTAESSQPGVNASLERAGHIAGTVKGEGAGALAGVTVVVNAYNGQWYDWAGQAETGPDGTYDVGNLPAGQYRVQFLAPPSDQGYWADEWYVDAAQADEGVDVTVDAGSTTSPVDAALAPGGGISGTVRSEQGDPVAWADVSCCRLVGEGEEAWWRDVAWTQTGDEGHFRIGGLAPGDYRIEIFDGSGTYASEVYDGALNFGGGTDIAVVAGEDTMVDPVLGLGGRIAGRVLDEQDQPLEGVKIEFEARVADPGGGQHWEYYTETYTGPDGRFEAAGLVPTRTLVHVVDESRRGASEFYDNAQTRAGAYPVIVTATQRTDIGDIVLAPPGAISGRVTTVEGDPVGGLEVYCGRWNDDAGGFYEQIGGPYPVTDQNGHYELLGLDPGDYQVWPAPYNDYLMDDFPEVPVVAGATTGGVDLVLQHGSFVQGTVRDISGQPLEGVQVGVGYGNRGDGMMTGPSGQYCIGPLGAGEATLGFEPPEGSGLRAEWWDNKTTWEDAEPLVIGYGQVFVIDAVLAPDSDVDPPATQVSGGDGLWHATAVTLSLTAEDPDGPGPGDYSGVEKTEFRIDDGQWSEAVGGEVVVGAPSDHSMDGARTVWYRSIDFAGNVETARSVEVLIDTTGPDIESDADGLWHSGSVLVNVWATDAGEGSVASLEYRRASMPAWLTGDSFIVRYVRHKTGRNGENVVRVRAVDGLGNESIEQVIVKIDTRPPLTTDDYDGLPHAEEVTVHFTVTDALSGGLRTYYSVDGTSWLVGDQVTIPALPAAANDGEHLIRYFSVDNAGNVETTVRSCLVTIDTSGG